MPSFLSQIIVSTNCSFPRAEIIAIVDAAHILTPNESKQEWLKEGNQEVLWSGSTSIIKVTDREVGEISYLLEPLIDESNNESPVINGRRWHFIEPDINSELYRLLSVKGEVAIPFSEILPYIVERTL